MSRIKNRFHSTEEAARHIKAAVKDRTGLTVSSGGATNKYLAKIASGMRKPDGLTLIAPGDEAAFMSAQPVGKIWGAGARAQEQFHQRGIKTCADLAAFSLETLQASFGKAFGTFLYKAVRGEAAEDFDAPAKSHSISSERTFEYDLFEREAIENELFDLCQSLIYRLLEEKQQAHLVFIKIRYGDFSTEGIQQRLEMPIFSTNELFKLALALFDRKFKPKKGLRLLGCGLGGLEAQGSPWQDTLFENKKLEKERRLEEAVFRINKKFPENSLKRLRQVNAN
jgi:DNA polymerase-4